MNKGNIKILHFFLFILVYNINTCLMSCNNYAKTWDIRKCKSFFITLYVCAVRFTHTHSSACVCGGLSWSQCLRRVHNVRWCKDGNQKAIPEEPRVPWEHRDICTDTAWTRNSMTSHTCSTAWWTSLLYSGNFTLIHITFYMLPQ